MKQVDKQIRKVSNKLIFLIRKKFPNDPYSLFITRWDDNSFMAIASSSTFNLPQQQAIRQKEYIRIERVFQYYRGKITYREKETKMQGDPSLPIVK